MKMGKFDQFVRKYTEAFTKHDAHVVASLYAKDAVVYDPFYPHPLKGEAIRKDAESFFRAFPDVEFEITNVFAKGDTEGAAEGRATGTHKGPLAGPQGDIPPTNKRFDMPGALFVRLSGDGKIVEERRYGDSGTIMRQLGLMETPEAEEVPLGS